MVIVCAALILVVVIMIAVGFVMMRDMCSSVIFTQVQYVVDRNDDHRRH
jgi:hypothetical protein